MFHTFRLIAKLDRTIVPHYGLVQVFAALPCATASAYFNVFLDADNDKVP